MRRIYAFPLMLFVSFLSFSQPRQSTNDILNAVQKKYSSVKNISADFIQKRTLRFGNSIQEELGKIIISSDDKYKIETETQTLVTDGATVWVYSHVRNQVLIGTNTTTEMNFSLNKFLLGLPADYSAVLLSAKDSLYVLQLRSLKKKPDPLMPSVFTVKIRKKDFLISVVEYLDRNKTKTEITLANILINQKLPKQYFEFRIPANTAVVDTRKMK